MSSPSFTVSFLSLSLFLALPFIAKAVVPATSTFKFVNEGEFGPYITEYDGYYRILDIASSPFRLCFYNTTPNTFTLALQMGLARTTSVYRWVWEANRGNPVRENATLTFGSDGNLILVDADGRVAWQTNTANKGVVGLKLLPIGNMVLYDSKGSYIWQSFDYPTNTLLVGQSLTANGIARLVSRASETDNSDGAYSLVMEPKGLALYYKTKNSPKAYLYYTNSNVFSVYKGSLQYLTLDCSLDTYMDAAYELNLKYQVATNPSINGDLFLARPKYNSTLTFLRLDMDGNVRLYTFYIKVDWGAWEVTYALFSTSRDESECQLPEKCGNFGLCEEGQCKNFGICEASQCVACPLPNGLMGWSNDCKPIKLSSSCGKNDFSYYKVEGVDHFMSKYTKGDGPMKENECMNKCTKDCKCLGFFFHQVTSRCWTANDLNTLTKVANSTHVAYIKTPK